jgi:hypothetical protein
VSGDLGSELGKGANEGERILLRDELASEEEDGAIVGNAELSTDGLALRKPSGVLRAEEGVVDPVGDVMEPMLGDAVVTVVGAIVLADVAAVTVAEQGTKHQAAQRFTAGGSCLQ